MNGGKMPMNGGKMPMNGGKMPMNGGKMPINGGKMPMNGNKKNSYLTLPDQHNHTPLRTRDTDTSSGWGYSDAGFRNRRPQSTNLPHSSTPEDHTHLYRGNTVPQIRVRRNLSTDSTHPHQVVMLLPLC